MTAAAPYSDAEASAPAPTPAAYVVLATDDAAVAPNVTVPAIVAVPSVLSAINSVSVSPAAFLLIKESFPALDTSNLVLFAAAAPILIVVPKCDTPVPGSATVPSLNIVMPADDITALVFTSSP